MRFAVNKAKVVFGYGDVKELVQDAGVLGALMMYQYKRLACKSNPDMEDETIAKILGRLPEDVTEARLALTEAGWFTRTYLPNRDRVLYDVGKMR